MDTFFPVQGCCSTAAVAGWVLSNRHKSFSSPSYAITIREFKNLSYLGHIFTLLVQNTILKKRLSLLANLMDFKDYWWLWEWKSVKIYVHTKGREGYKGRQRWFLMKAEGNKWSCNIFHGTNCCSFDISWAVVHAGRRRGYQTVWRILECSQRDTLYYFLGTFVMTYNTTKSFQR